MSTVTNSLNKVFFRQSATPEYSIASQETGVVYYGSIVDGGLLIDDSGDGSLLPGPFATLVPYMDGDRVAFVLRSRRPLILSVEGGFAASDEYAGLASIGEVNAEAASDAAVLAQQAKDRAEAASDAFEEFVPEVEPGERILAGLLIAGPGDGFHTELDQTGVHFHSLVDGVTGPVEMLQINTPGTDGDAGNVFTLRDPTDLGSLSMSINEAGQTSTSDLTVSNLTQLQDVAIRGRTFEDYLDTLPRGVVAWGEGLIAASRTIAASTVVTFGTINFVAEPGRMYRVVATGPSVQASVASTVSVRLEINGDVGAQYGWLGAGWNKADMTRVYDASSLTVETQTTVAYLIGASGGTGLTHGTYRNLTIIVEDVGPAITPEISLAVSQTGDAPVVPAKKQYTKTYAASWLRTYTANGSMSTYYNGKATQGNYGAGEMRGVIGFPNMLGDIGSADIVRVEAYVYMAHWWNNSGGTATIAMSAHASAPGTLSAGLSGGVATVKTAKPGGGWVTLPSSVWAGLKAGTWRGIGLIGTGQAGYGYATTAQLRVTYKK